MTKGSIIKCVISLVLVTYLVIALSFTSRKADADLCKGLVVNVVDSAKRGFVTSEDILLELGPIAQSISATRHDSLNTYAIEQLVMQADNIEKANCVLLNDGTVRLDVTPLIPMARVIDTKGESYYINRSCKRMQANTRYRVDVPVLVGHFDEQHSPKVAFPLLDFLSSNPDWAALTSAIEVTRRGDLVLVPTIRGHVVNIGDTNDLKNKFDRLQVFYRKVMPAKGWEYYDTLSVKWRGQVVAKRRHVHLQAPQLIVEEHNDLDDVSTMLTVQ